MQVGIDFGTSNTGVAVYDQGKLELLKLDEDSLKSLKSAIFFNSQKDIYVGQEALDLSLQNIEWGRLIRWIKRALPKKIDKIKIFGKVFTVEDLIAILLREVKTLLINRDIDTSNIMAGKPVTLGKTEAEHELAIQRLRKAFSLAGFEQVSFVEEPSAAAWYYRQKIADDSIALLVDIGGGTTDFSLVRYRLTNQLISCDIIDTTGIAIAGQDFDDEIWLQKIGPLLGRKLPYTFAGDTEILPARLFEFLLSPEKAQQIFSPQYYKFLTRSVKASDRAEFKNLKYVADNYLSTYLLGACEQLKLQLSDPSSTTAEQPIQLQQEYQVRLDKAAFQSIIQVKLKRIKQCLDVFLDKNQIPVDRVILTGGMAKHHVIQEKIKEFILQHDLKREPIFLTEETDAIVYGLASWGKE